MIFIGRIGIVQSRSDRLQVCSNCGGLPLIIFRCFNKRTFAVLGSRLISYLLVFTSKIGNK